MKWLMVAAVVVALAAPFAARSCGSGLGLELRAPFGSATPPKEEPTLEKKIEELEARIRFLFYLRSLDEALRDEKPLFQGNETLIYDI